MANGGMTAMERYKNSAPKTSSVTGNSYSSVGTHNDSTLSAADQATINQYKSAYDAAKATGNTSAMEQAHAAAEAVRKNYSYSGGGDGSEYIGLSQPSAASGSSLPSATSQAGYINGLYDAQQKAAIAALQSAYEQNMLTIDENAKAIEPYYREAKNATAAQNEIEKASFNEYAAASGLSNGAGGQAALAQSNAHQSNMSAIDKAQADALAKVEAQRTSVKVDYQNQIAQAIANGDLERASALYQEAVRVDESIVNTALNQADLDYKYLLFNTEQEALARQAALSSAQNSYINNEVELDLDGGKPLMGDEVNLSNIGAAATAILNGAARGYSTPSAIAGLVQEALAAQRITEAEADFILKSIGY